MSRLLFVRCVMLSYLLGVVGCVFVCRVLRRFVLCGVGVVISVVRMGVLCSF